MPVLFVAVGKRERNAGYRKAAQRWGPTPWPTPFILISHTCAASRQLQLSSYDRLFPNQDTLPKGGFGNLIALPLQKTTRQRGCSVVVDVKGLVESPTKG